MQMEYFTAPIWGTWRIMHKTPSPSLPCSQILRGVPCEWISANSWRSRRDPAWALTAALAACTQQPGPLPSSPLHCIPHPPLCPGHLKYHTWGKVFSSGATSPVLCLGGLFSVRGGSSVRTEMGPLLVPGHSGTFCRGLATCQALI